MSAINFQINGKPESLNSVWVHLQDVKSGDSSTYRIQIPLLLIKSIFDPYDTKPETTTWSAFIQSHIEELGTFIVDGYLEAMVKVNGEGKAPFYWVLATIDKIDETAEGIELIGKMVSFQPRG